MNEERDSFYSDEEYYEAVKRYEDMLKKKTSYFFDVSEFEEIIDYYIDINKVNYATDAAKLASQQHPESIVIQLKVAQILVDKNQPRDALRILNRIEKMETSHYEVYILKGTAYNHLGKTAEAVKYFDLALMLVAEGKEEVLYNIGLCFEHTFNYKLALNYLEQSYRIEPSNISLVYDLAFCYERVEQLDKSIRFYNMYLDEDPFSENVWYNLGIVYTRLEQYPKAIEAYDFAIAIDPMYSSAYFNKANTLANLEEYAQAIEVYKEFIEIEPESPQAYCYIGECHEKLGQFDQAIECYKKAIEQENDYSEAWFGMGVVMMQLRLFGDSLYYITKSLELEPENTEYIFAMGNVLAKLNRKNEALMAYRKVMDFDPEDYEAWLGCSEVFYNNGELEKAIEILEEGYPYNAFSALFNYRLAAYYFKLGKKALAYPYLEKGLSLDYEEHEDLFLYCPEANSYRKVQQLINKYEKFNQLPE